MSDLTYMSISEIKNGLSNKDFSAYELTQAYIKKMQEMRHLNAYISETPEVSLTQAKECDERLARGEELRLMEGIPIGIKDLFCTQGIHTTAGSKVLGNYIPPYESTVTSKLKEAGAIVLGKLNMDEFAMGSSNLTSAFGPTINPWQSQDKEGDFVPGGSSGGSAAAVAAGIALGATGTDTGGSIRQPAAFTGIVGMKPTYGRCSRWGIIAFASSLDQAGPMARTVLDCAIMLEAMAGFDAKDATSVDIPVPSYKSLLSGHIKGLRVGIPQEYHIKGMNPQIEKIWTQGIKWLQDSGAEIVDISLPHTKYALPVYYILAPAEASSNLARYDGVRYGLRVPAETLDEMYENTRAQGFGREVKRRIMIGTYVLSAGYYDAYYLKAQKIRRLITQDFQEAYKKVDLILTPTTPNAAFMIGEEPKDPITMYMNDVLTVTVNLAGLPAISVPAGLTEDGLPLGLQVIGPSFEEGRILNAAYVLEKAAQFSKQVKELRKIL
jgi:aspartyl-tRNA(Asn)/glutamyl-tRNA(Gln) amidotransferase subunit A